MWNGIFGPTNAPSLAGEKWGFKSIAYFCNSLSPTFSYKGCEYPVELNNRIPRFSSTLFRTKPLQAYNVFQRSRRQNHDLVYDPKVYSASQTDIKFLPVANRTSPSLQIKYDDVARYIAATDSLPIGEITEEKIREILLSEISYAPISLVEKLVGDREDNSDRECVMAILKLLVKGHLPASAQCPSILGIFVTDDGCDLTNYLLGSQSDEAKCFGVNLAIVGEKASHA